ncbi:LysR family transcriptional regulator [Ruegeria sp. EL01]|jgi:DNA-binding transcriptional LysR family regulator|uniref:LysR family transcriptional regulator n=1 Tax=Ruegeria sp. EL01 TaxID=2107578 RepID=UPI000EA82F02|nr:LysR family transcriptional regulator [Ruegeria sp. EL01]
MKRSDIPYLDDLRAFETTAQCGTVRSAADELSLTHAAVSRRINRLADMVGTPLFERSGRGLRLTAAGDRLAEVCRRSFDDLSRTIVSIRESQATDTGAILLSCERSVAMRWLIPRLSEFQDTHPEIAVHLSVGGGPVDSKQNRATLALRRLDFAIVDGWSVVPLFDETIGPVMSPDMFSDFEQGDYIALGSNTRPDAWDDWLRRNPDAPRPRERRMFDHHFLMVEAASSGLGVGLVPHIVALDDINRERLTAPLGFDPDGSRYGVLHPSQVPLDENAVLLLEWLRNRSRNI